MNDNERENAGIGLFGMIFIVFLILKLCGIGEVATWSWWWVTAPLWMPTAFIVVIFLIGVIAAAFLMRK